MNPLVTIADGLVNGGGALGACGVLAALGLIALARTFPGLRGTTLVEPWGWSLVVLFALLGVEGAAALAGPRPVHWAAPARYGAAMSTFCPVMALLGAKRPQDRAWQLIVCVLWLVLSLPAIEWLLYGGVAEIHPARFGFLIILIGTGALNRIGTRYWLSSVLYLAGQIALVAPFFFIRSSLPGAAAALLGTAAIVLSWWLIAIGFPRERVAAGSLDRVWLDFRDAFGVVWALRIAERVNASARMYGWQVELTWIGFAPRGPQEVGQLPPAVEESLRSLLRRFVSPEWIDARFAKSRNETSAHV